MQTTRDAACYVAFQHGALYRNLRIAVPFSDPLNLLGAVSAQLLQLSRMQSS